MVTISIIDSPDNSRSVLGLMCHVRYHLEGTCQVDSSIKEHSSLLTHKSSCCSLVSTFSIGLVLCWPPVQYFVRSGNCCILAKINTCSDVSVANSYLDQ